MPVPDDDSWMQMALRLAARGLGRTSPNPMVGCVIVNDGIAVGSGWHRRAGESHAEVLAIRRAGSAAKGATAFVTLEPCAHYGRTPPCADALIAAGVSRVVAAMEDPDPRTAGKGLAALRGAGIETQTGLLEDRARRLNEQYLHHRTTGRPFVTYKAGITLDGRTAAADGSSRWITSERARRDAHRLRAQSDAICAGIGTISQDDPQLTARGMASGRPLLRVVVDSKGRTPITARVLQGVNPTMIFTAAGDGAAGVVALKEAGAEVIGAPGRNGRVALRHILGVLGERGVVSMLLEGGPTLAGSFAAEGLIDKYVLYVAPKLVGDSPLGAVRGWGAAGISGALELAITQTTRVGPDLKVIAYPLGEAG